MRTINFEKDPEEFGNTEIGELLKHFGEEKVHINSVKRILSNLVFFFLKFSANCTSLLSELQLQYFVETVSFCVCFVVGPQEQALSSCGEQAWSEGRVGYSQDYS